MDNNKINKTEEEWKRELTPEQYRIMREKGTEAPYSGEYTNTNDKGLYTCAACGNQLFSSDAKFDSAQPGLLGWPSFEQAIPGSIEEREDKSDGMDRTEVVCARCGSHLGHVFDGGALENKEKHFCINSACLLLNKEA
jgi:peptide-methionine (R)-S-oxide reductase